MRLTWRDIQSIVFHADRIMPIASDGGWTLEQYYTEVLKAFKEEKKGNG